MVAVAITVAATKAIATGPAAMQSAKRHAAALAMEMPHANSAKRHATALSMDSPFTLRKQPCNASP